MTSRRSVMLPPYLAGNPAWQQLVESMDSVLQTEVDDPISLLQQIRDNWILDPNTSPLTVDNRELLDPSQFFQTDRETLIRQANMLGFLFKQTDLLSDDDYRRLVRNLGSYWFGKGTPKFVDFLAFCLNTALTVVKLWSTQGATYDTYGTFYEEGDPRIGTPNYLGGPWFETSHVHLVADVSRFPTSDLSKLIALFNTLANYDLVLDCVVFESTTDIHSPDSTVAKIVMAYPMVDIEQVIFTTISKPPTANFSWSTAPSNRENLFFLDASSNSATSWNWDFGPAAVPAASTAQNPIVDFNAGTWDVTLTVSNAFGSSSVTKSVVVSSAPALLQEDGVSYILLEDGAHLLLE